MGERTKVILMALTALAFPGVATTTLQAQYDLVISGARLLDGSGNPWRYAYVAVSGSTIVAVGDLS